MVLAWVLASGTVYAGSWQDRIKALAGAGAVAAAQPDGRMLFSHNPDKQLIPASTLKVVTAAAALDALGPGYRFTTDFRLSGQGDLYVFGRGDPYLVSEELEFIAGVLREKGLTRVNNIRLDNGFFPPGLVLDGTARTLNPYDAYNGALCVNFNTIFVNVDAKGGVTSAEPQTPLTSLAREMALKNINRGEVRINLAESPAMCLEYAGELIRAFLEAKGIEVTGRIELAADDSSLVPLFYRHESRRDLRWLIGQVFKYSNNFMANQIFLVMGAEKYGAPADPEKSRRVVKEFLASRGVEAFHVEEGSGLSRRTLVTAGQMIRVLRVFAPYRDLMTEKGPAVFKTGTLSDVKSMAGFLTAGPGEPLPFVILLNNEPGYAARAKILTLLEENLL